MNIRLLLSGFLSAIILFSCGKPTGGNIIIPAPSNIRYGDGFFRTSAPYVLKGDIDSSEYITIRGLLCKSPLFSPLPDDAVSGSGNNTIELILSPVPDGSSATESYMLNIAPGKTTVTASGYAGIMYGVQSLIQLAEVHEKKIPAQTITDAPRFPYRGLMLDVSRHFMSTDFIKKQLDAMARYKLNRFHWHLTDGAGWRLRIERYPLLTEIAAWRPYPTWKEWQHGGRLYCRYDDPNAYGGFYTAEEAKDIVDYAARLNIEVIPEIEMPGHSEEVLAVYPELSCAGKPYTGGEFCIGNEKTFEFIENVLAEVIAIFPSEYIHIGGDEASKSHWEKCPKCQFRIRDENLGDEAGLQSYMIRRVEKFLNAHGRRLMGWDEILEGGLAPNATVMSWRGTEGGIAAAELGHDAIMTPGAYCYLDYYQDAPPTQPEAMPVILTAKKAYSYDPAPDSLPDNIRSHIKGVQANLWTERILTYEHAEYMIYPRLLAIAEVAWSEPANKDYDDFYVRALRNIEWLRGHDYNTFDLAGEVGDRPESKKQWPNKALGKPVHYNTPWHKKYTAAAETTLTDGLRGDWSYGDGRWQGFLDSDFDVVIDMGHIESISEVWAEFMQSFSADIWMPAEVIISISGDGTDYMELASVATRTPFEHSVTCFETFGWKGEAEARYIRVTGRSNGHAGGWIFTDEIFVK